jgi:hypothetical protein
VLTFRWIALFGVVAVATAALTGGMLAAGNGSAIGQSSPAGLEVEQTSVGSGGLRCPHRIPMGVSFQTAWQTTVFFVTDVVLRENPVCGYDLSSRAMRAGLSRAQWAHGDGPVKTFVTQYPAVPIKEASEDPAAPEAVYVLSRTVREAVVSDGRGRVKVPMKVGLFAPDAGMAAYNIDLVLENGHWRVDQAIEVRLTMSDEPDAGRAALAG